MPTGTIFSYVLSRGFGFIEPSDPGPQVFFHIDHVIPDNTGNNIFSDGTKVSYELIPDGNKQFRASQITKLVQNHGHERELRLGRKKAQEEEEIARLRRKRRHEEHLKELPRHRRILNDPQHRKSIGLKPEVDQDVSDLFLSKQE
jgi:cold shock CspA family protein